VNIPFTPEPLADTLPGDAQGSPDLAV